MTLPVTMNLSFSLTRKRSGRPAFALSGANSIEAWDKYIRSVDRFNFKHIPTDILGRTFQKLIGPEERQKFGQYYTDENIVDVINAFCIRNGTMMGGP